MGQRFHMDFYKAEVRDGFYIEGMMKRAWAVQLDMLKMISDICEKYQISCFAIYGTLLGAVRHGGYIPWDDDIDLAMLRPDYERFLSVLECELPEGFYVNRPALQSGGKVISFPHMHCQIINGTRVNYSREFLKRFHGCPYPVFVDIFPLDGLPDDLEEQKRYLSFYKLIRETIMIQTEFKILDEERLDLIEQIGKMKFDRSENVYGQLILLLDEQCKKYPVGAGRFVTILHFRYLSNIHYERKWFESAVKFPFEDMTISCPCGFDAILKQGFGANYMIPRNTQSAHGYPVYQSWYKQVEAEETDEMREREKLFADRMGVRVREIKELFLLFSSGFFDYYCYFFEGEYYINRVWKGQASPFYDSERERKVYDRLAGEGDLALNPVFCDGQGNKVARLFENGHYLNMEDTEQTAGCMDVLKAFHHVGFDERDVVTPLEQLRRYQEKFPDVLSDKRDFRKVQAEVMELAEELKAYPMQDGLVHMALKPESFLFYSAESGKEIRLLNMKYAGCGDTDWDLGILSANLLLDPEKIERLVWQYYGNGMQEEEKKKRYEKILRYAAIAAMAHYVRQICDEQKTVYKCFVYVKKCLKFIRAMENAEE